MFRNTRETPMKAWRSASSYGCLLLGLFHCIPISAESSAPDPDIAARQAYVTGQPPRIAPLSHDSYGTEALSMVNELRASLDLPPGTDISEYFATMLRHPQLMQRQIEMSKLLFNGELSPRDRELAILRVAWLLRAPYEWGEHVHVGKRLAGLSTEDIERVTVGSSATGWTEHERALLRAVEELLADAMISDETWAILARGLNDKQLLEFPLLVGFYQSIAYLQNSVRFRLGPGNVGLTER